MSPLPYHTYSQSVVNDPVLLAQTRHSHGNQLRLPSLPSRIATTRLILRGREHCGMPGSWRFIRLRQRSPPTSYRLLLRTVVRVPLPPVIFGVIAPQATLRRKVYRHLSREGTFLHFFAFSWQLFGWVSLGRYAIIPSRQVNPTSMFDFWGQHRMTELHVCNTSWPANSRLVACYVSITCRSFTAPRSGKEAPSQDLSLKQTLAKPHDAWNYNNLFSPSAMI